MTDALGKMDDNVHEVVMDDDFSLRDLLPNSMAKFYRYSGSLTTPACNEIVTWTVFDEAITASEKQVSQLNESALVDGLIEFLCCSAQLAQFRKLKSEDGDQLVNNYRPPQPLLGRTVYVRSGSGNMAASLAAVLVPILAVLTL